MTWLAILAAAALGLGVGWVLGSRRGRRRDLERERLFAFISHELTTPVTGLHLTVRNFMSGVFGPIPDEHRSWFQMMSDQLDWAGSLVADLNDLFHLEFGRRMRLDSCTLSLGEVARGVMERMRPQAERWGLKWTADIVEGLPPVQGDPSRLGRVFKSLLGHALKFSTQDGEVRLSLRPSGRWVQAEISFTALEANAEDPRWIFDRFYPVSPLHSGKTVKTTGVGLNVAKEIVERHGGRLAYEAGPSGAGRFLLSLPVEGEA